jgi:hypothetical protein
VLAGGHSGRCAVRCEAAYTPMSSKAALQAIAGYALGLHGPSRKRGGMSGTGHPETAG